MKPFHRTRTAILAALMMAALLSGQSQAEESGGRMFGFRINSGSVEPTPVGTTEKRLPASRFTKDPTPADGLRNLDGICPVTKAGLFKGRKEGSREHSAVVETTGIYGAFRPGERFFSATLHPETRKPTLSQMEDLLNEMRLK